MSNQPLAPAKPNVPSLEVVRFARVFLVGAVVLGAGCDQPLSGKAKDPVVNRPVVQGEAKPADPVVNWPVAQGTPKPADPAFNWPVAQGTPKPADPVVNRPIDQPREKAKDPVVNRPVPQVESKPADPVLDSLEQPKDKAKDPVLDRPVAQVEQSKGAPKDPVVTSPLADAFSGDAINIVLKGEVRLMGEGAKAVLMVQARFKIAGNVTFIVGRTFPHSRVVWVPVAEIAAIEIVGRSVPGGGIAKPADPGIPK